MIILVILNVIVPVIALLSFGKDNFNVGLFIATTIQSVTIIALIIKGKYLEITEKENSKPDEKENKEN